ncbi:MAG: DUF1465 family protein [Pseudomonadota bacterium]
MSSVHLTASGAVSFVDRFARSEQFDALFREGMALVEATADYLDGDGRKASRELASGLSVVYATESMRLTTRLLEVASWLVIQRALKDGELTETEAHEKRERVKLRPMTRPSHIKQFSELPTGLQALIMQSYAVTDRLVAIDKAMSEDRAPQRHTLNPVADQMKRLETAFASGSQLTH